MHEADDKVLVEVLIPRARVAEFYSLMGRWYQASQKATEPKAASNRGRPKGSGRRYLPLAEHLARTQGNRTELSLDQIDRLLGAALPTSAKKFRTFWANSDTPQGRSWASAGFRVSQADVAAGTIVFERL
jgi:hypothetical protein